VELNKKGDSESTCEEEIEEFLEMLEEVRKSKKKDLIIKHLHQTAFVVACQIPTSDFEDDGFNAVGTFLQYFLQHSGGMIQADGEGFYDGTKLVVALA
jgi:hypothetical protein